jgi:predicted nucleic acid-binding protein
MRVADTSYIAEGLLRRWDLFETEQLLVPELAIYEVENVVWKHEKLIGDVAEGVEYLETLGELIRAGAITVVSYSEKLLKRAYTISIAHGVAIYDSIFLALALETGMELVTLDKDQMKLFESERRERTGRTRKHSQ